MNGEEANPTVKDWVDVTGTAEQVGMGFDALGMPVALSREVWRECVEWTEEDTKRQTQQEQDARLWEVLFAGGAALEMYLTDFLKAEVHSYFIRCIRRDGSSTAATGIQLAISFRITMGKNGWL